MSRPTLTVVFSRGTVTAITATGISEDETLFRNKPFIDLQSALHWLDASYSPTHKVIVTADRELRRLLNG